jgi:hypothetical protein
MGERARANAYLYGVSYSPNIAKGERVTWGCIDERPMIVNGLHLTMHDRTIIDRRHGNHQLYRQSVAGAQGLGEMIHIATRMDGGTYADLAPAHVMGSVAAQEARKQGVDILNHQKCAGEDGAQPINEGIATNTGPNGEDIYEVIRDSHANPKEFTKQRFERVSNAAYQSLEQGMLQPLAERQQIFDEGGTYHNGHRAVALDPVGRAPLVDMPHVSDGEIIDWRQGVAFDAQRALADSDLAEGNVKAYYHASLGDMSELYAAAVKPMANISYQFFEDAAFVRNAATSLWLPHQHDQPVQLQPIR